MDRLFLDTNTLLDLAFDHRPGSDAALKLFKLCETGSVRGMATASSLKDFYYVARRSAPEANRREWVQLFLDSFEIVELSRAICQSAVISDEPDFEDALVRVAAEAHGATHIISRDMGAFRTSSIPRLTAEEYLASCS